jgi:hypothetical protein
MSKKRNKLSDEQKAILKKIADVISKYVTSGTVNNLPVDKNTGEIRPKNSLDADNNQNKATLLPEELYELFQDIFQDDVVPPDWLARLKKLKADIERSMENLTVEERRQIRERMRSTPRGQTASSEGFSDEMKAAMEQERKLRQEFGTEILNAIEEAMEEQSQQGEEDGEEDGKEAQDFEDALDEADDGDEADGSEGQGAESEEGAEDAWEAQNFEDSLEEGDDGDDTDGEIPGLGDQASQTGDSAFDLGSGTVDEGDLAQFMSALEMIMARQADNPDRLPKWNKRELAKRNATFRNPKPAKRPILQQQAVVFLIDDSGSMDTFQDQANTLARAIFEAGWVGRSSLVLANTFNGQYRSTVVMNQNKGYWVNGKLKGTLPDPEQYGENFKKNAHALHWKWWLEEYLPKEHNIIPRVVIFFSDSHGGYQWNYLSSNTNGMTIVWLEPADLTEDSYRDDNGGARITDVTRYASDPPMPLKEWTRSPFVKGFSPDDSFSAGGGSPNSFDWEDIPIDFRRFDGRFFSSVDSIDDMIEAIKIIANI